MLGVGGLIVGMEAAIGQMCEGEIVKATIPGPLAFNTKSGSLPYHTSIMYEIELFIVTRGVVVPKPEPIQANVVRAIGTTGSQSLRKSFQALAWIATLVMLLAVCAYLAMRTEKAAQKKNNKEAL